MLADIEKFTYTRVSTWLMFAYAAAGWCLPRRHPAETILLSCLTLRLPTIWLLSTTHTPLVGAIPTASRQFRQLHLSLDNLASDAREKASVAL